MNKDTVESLEAQLQRKRDLLTDLPYGGTPLVDRAFHKKRLTTSIADIQLKLARLLALIEAKKALPHFQEPPYGFEYQAHLISAVVTPLFDETEKEFLERAVRELESNI